MPFFLLYRYLGWTKVGQITFFDCLETLICGYLGAIEASGGQGGIRTLGTVTSTHP